MMFCFVIKLNSVFFLNSLQTIEFDHLSVNVQNIWEEKEQELSSKEEKTIVRCWLSNISRNICLRNRTKK